MYQSKKLLRKLNYEFHAAGADVVEYGTYGDKLFLIVQGSVGVWIPTNYGQQPQVQKLDEVTKKSEAESKRSKASRSKSKKRSKGSKRR